MSLPQWLAILLFSGVLLSVSETQEVEDMCGWHDCPVGQQCVFDLGTGVRCVCRLDTDCPAVSRPMCGSDGRIYKNICVMKATACREDRKITRVWSCRPNNACEIKPTSPCRAYFPRFYYNTTTRQCERFIAGGCHPSGWNGFKTAEQCRSACAEKGNEDACKTTKCPAGQKCVPEATTGRATCVCRHDAECPAEPLGAVLCGSDGKFYNNACVMAATACREGRNISQAKTGRCRPDNACKIKPTSACMAYFPRFFYNTTTGTCQKFIAGGCHASGWNGFHTEKECTKQCVVTRCKEEKMSAPLYGILIGSGSAVGSVFRFGCDDGYKLDGKTEIFCLASGQWSGRPPVCKETCEITKCPVGQKCVPDATTGRAACVCRHEAECPSAPLGAVLCGSDGKFYNNTCAMAAAACMEGRDISQAKTERCRPDNACEIKPTSPCRGYFPHFYYNTTTRRCEQFIAGGCHPSGWNGFKTAKQCRSACAEKGQHVCPACPQPKLAEACRDSSFVIVGRVTEQLKRARKHHRYILDIERVLKSGALSLPQGKAVLSIPYGDSPDCACPSLPLNKKVLIGSSGLRIKKMTSVKTEITLTGKVFAFEMSAHIKRKMRRAKCVPTSNGD